MSTQVTCLDICVMSIYMETNLDGFGFIEVLFKVRHSVTASRKAVKVPVLINTTKCQLLALHLGILNTSMFSEALPGAAGFINEHRTHYMII